MKHQRIYVAILTAACLSGCATAKKPVLGMALPDEPLAPAIGPATPVAKPAVFVPPAPSAPPSPTSLIQPSVNDVFTAHCIRCHSGERAPQHIDLTSYETTMKPTNRGALIVNSDAPKSLLYQAVLGLSPGGQMPNQSEPLSWREIRSIRRWIDGGATAAGFYDRFRMTSMGGSVQ